MSAGQSWTGGLEAIHTKSDRAKPWASTVFSRRHDGLEADALVAMTFGATPKEAAQLARQISAFPQMLAALKLCLPPNVCLTNRNVPDHWVVPLECTMGDLRQIAAAIAAAEAQP
jgi:hypothetical protein